MNGQIAKYRTRARIVDMFGEEWEPTGQLRLVAPSVGEPGTNRRGSAATLQTVAEAIGQLARLQQEWVCMTKQQGTMWRDVPVVPERFATA